MNNENSISALSETVKILKLMFMTMWGGSICLSPFMLKEPEGLIPFLVLALSIPLFLYLSIKSEKT